MPLPFNLKSLPTAGTQQNCAQEDSEIYFPVIGTLHIYTWVPHFRLVQNGLVVHTVIKYHCMKWICQAALSCCGQRLSSWFLCFGFHPRKSQCVISPFLFVNSSRLGLVGLGLAQYFMVSLCWFQCGNSVCKNDCEPVAIGKMHDLLTRGPSMGKTRTIFADQVHISPICCVINEVHFPVYKPVDYTWCNSSLSVCPGRLLIAGIVQLAHTVGTSIFYHKVWRHSSS